MAREGGDGECKAQMMWGTVSCVSLTDDVGHCLTESLVRCTHR